MQITQRKKHQGFTLVELIITVLMLVILIGLAVPSFNSILLRVKVSSTADSLVSAINFSRSTAISRNQTIILCALAANEIPNPVCDSTATDWNRGWIVTDINGVVLKYWRMGDDDREIQLSDSAINHDSSQVRFNSLGDASLFTAASNIVVSALEFNLEIQGCESPQLRIHREITIQPWGAINIEAQDCS